MQDRDCWIGDSWNQLVQGAACISPWVRKPQFDCMLEYLTSACILLMHLIEYYITEDIAQTYSLDKIQTLYTFSHAKLMSPHTATLPSTLNLWAANQGNLRRHLRNFGYLRRPILTPEQISYSYHTYMYVPTSLPCLFRI